MAEQPDWTAAEIRALRLVYGRKMAKDCASDLPGRSAIAIMLKAHAIGLKSDRSTTRKIYQVNERYFAAPNLENCYWAGFIAADEKAETFLSMLAGLAIPRLTRKSEKWATFQREAA